MSLSYQVKSSQVNFISDIKIYNTVKYTIFKNRNKHRNKKPATVFQNQRRAEKQGERGIFEIFIWGKIAGDETSETIFRKKIQNEFKSVLINELYDKLFKQLFFLIGLPV